MNKKFIIFCFYITLLALIPCGDKCINKLCQTESGIHIETGQTEEDHTDNCSPFCNCMCCNEIVSFTKEITLNNTNNKTAFSSSFISEIPPIKIKPSLPPPRS